MNTLGNSRWNCKIVYYSVFFFAENKQSYTSWDFEQSFIKNKGR